MRPHENRLYDRALSAGIDIYSHWSKWLFPLFPEPPQVTPFGIQFWTAATGSHFVAFAFAIQALAGLLLLSGFFVPLALILIAAELYNILAYHLTLNPGFAPGIAGCVLWVLVFIQYRASFNAILSAKPALRVETFTEG